MSLEQRNVPDDVIERAIAARKAMVIPGGPPLPVLAKTIEQLKVATVGTFSMKRRFFTMKNMRRLAVAAVLAVAIAGAVFFLSRGSSVAFADVLKGVRAAKSVSFKGSGTIEMPGLPPQPISMQVTITASGRMRQTIEPIGMIMIVDRREGKWLSLDPKNKQATVMELSNVPAGQSQGNLLDEFRTIDDKAGTAIGEKEIAGRKSRGFRVVAPATEMSIWVDSETRLPVLVEQTLKIATLPVTMMTMTDFVWDAPVDESQFSLAAPEGYSVQRMQMNMAPATEKDLIDSFKAAAELNDGVFPQTFDIVGVSAAMGRSFAKLIMKKDTPEWKAMQTRSAQAMSIIGRGFMFVNDPKNGEDWHYAGKDVQLGKAGVPVFWYRPTRSTNYRVIDADLSVRDTRPEDLPKVPATHLGPATKPAH